MKPKISKEAFNELVRMLLIPQAVDAIGIATEMKSKNLAKDIIEKFFDHEEEN